MKSHVYTTLFQPGFILDWDEIVVLWYYICLGTDTNGAYVPRNSDLNVGIGELGMYGVQEVLRVLRSYGQITYDDEIVRLADTLTPKFRAEMAREANSLICDRHKGTIKRPFTNNNKLRELRYQKPLKRIKL